MGTYIRLLADFVFLAVILDACSCKVVGWALSRHINSDLACAALKAAIAQRKPPFGCIHHSDRGVQYASHSRFSGIQILKDPAKAGFHMSMCRKGNPYDNAKTESFFKTLKCEEVHLWEYRSMTEVQERISIFIDQVYNKERLHSALGYQTPQEYEYSIKQTTRHVLTLTSSCPT